METLENETASSPPSQAPESGQEQNPTSTLSDHSDSGPGIQDVGAGISDLKSASADQARVGSGSEATVGGIDDGAVRVSAEGVAGDEEGSGAAGLAAKGGAQELKVGDGDSSVVDEASVGGGGEDGIRSQEAIVPEAKEHEEGGKGLVLARQVDDDCTPQSNGPGSDMNVDLAGQFQDSNSGVKEGAPVEATHSQESPSGVAEVAATDVCEAENGQDGAGDIAEEVEKNEDDMMVEAPVSPVDKMQVVADDGDDGGAVVRQQVAPEAAAIEGEEGSRKEKEVMEMEDISEGKEEMASESRLSAAAQVVATEVCLRENGQDQIVLDENQNTQGDVCDADITSADEKQQIKPEIEAVGGEEGEVPEKVGISMSEEGDGNLSNESSLSPPVAVPEKVGFSVIEESEGGLNNESVLPAPAPTFAANVSLPENGQDLRAEAVESPTSGPGNEKAETVKVIEAAISAADEKQKTGDDAGDVGINVFNGKQNTGGDAGDVDITISGGKQKTGGGAEDVGGEGDTVLDGKQQTMQAHWGGEGEDSKSQGKELLEESVLGHVNSSAGIEVAELDSSKVSVMDVCLPENVQESVSEVGEMHVESDVLVLDEKQNSAANVTVYDNHSAQQMQQNVPESVTGKEEQIAGQGNGSLDCCVTSHQSSSTEIEVTTTVTAFAAVSEGVMDTQITMFEMSEAEGNEVGKPPIDPLCEKQNNIDDAAGEGITLSDEKQQIEMDACSSENGQNPGVEVSKKNVGSSDACLDEKQQTAAGPADGEHMVVTSSAANEIQQVTVAGEFSEDGVSDHVDVKTEIEVSKPPQSQDMVVDVCLEETVSASGDEVVETLHSVPEMLHTEQVESVEVSTSPSVMKISDADGAAVTPNEFLKDSCPSEEKQSNLVKAKELVEKLNDADDVTDTDISPLYEKGQQAVTDFIEAKEVVVEKDKDANDVTDTDVSVVHEKGLPTVTELIAGEKEATAGGDQSMQDQVLNCSNGSAGVEAMETNVSLPGMDEKEDEDEVDEDEEEADDEEDDFSVGDFVWGKIKSHPWWPGQIYDPSDASDFAKKYRRRDRLLVAYFGDGTFAWCYPSQLKPFNRCFERMMKQSSTKSFLNAVEEALSELSRCVESEMTCLCVSEERKVRLGLPLAVNAGIKEGTTVPKGHIDELSINEFDPAIFIGRLKEIAQVVSVRDTLELTVLKSRLSAFYGAKGYSELPTYHLPRGISDPEEDAKNLLSEEGQMRNLTDTTTEELVSPPAGPGAGKSCSSDKRLQVSEDKIYQRRKRSVAELMADHIDMEFVNDRHVKDEAPVFDRPATSSKDHKKTKLSAASLAAEEEDSDIDKDVSDEGKSVGKSASSFKKRKKGKHLDTSHSSLTENKVSDVENDDNGEEVVRTTSKSAPSSKKRKNIKHSASSPSTTAENKASDLENEDSGEEVRTSDKSALSSKNRKKTKDLESSPPSSSDNKVTFDDEINDDEAEEGAVLSSPRNRRRSRYLSAPYTMLGGQKSIVSAEDTETGNAKAPMVSRVGASISKIAVQLTGASQNVKSSGKKFQKKVSKEPSSEDKTPGTAGPQTGRRNRKSLKEEEMAADEMFSDTLSAPSDSMQPKGGRKGRSSITENDSSGNDPYELKFGEKRGKEEDQTSSKTPKRKSRKSSLEDTAPHSAALILTFEPGFALPSKDVLIEVFSKYGALIESETEVMQDSGCAQVVFTRSSDAEEAFNGSDKEAAFKPATVSYRLRYLSTAPKVSEPESPPSAAADGTVAPPPTENLAETQPLLYMQQNIESMMSLLSKFTGKEPGQAAKLTPTVRADLTVELGCLLQKVSSLVEDP